MTVTATASTSEPNGSPTRCATTSAWCTAASTAPTRNTAISADTSDDGCRPHEAASTTRPATGGTVQVARRREAVVMGQTLWNHPPATRLVVDGNQGAGSARDGRVHPRADPHDPDRAAARDVPRRPRPDHREHVDPHHRRRPRRPVHPGVGDHGVPHHRDDHDADLRQARRPLRPQEAVHVRDLGLHRRLGAVHVRDLDVRTGGVPCLPGARCGRSVHAGARDHRRHRLTAGARQVHRLLHGHVRHARACSARSSAASSPARTSCSA